MIALRGSYFSSEHCKIYPGALVADIKGGAVLHGCLCTFFSQSPMLKRRKSEGPIQAKATSGQRRDTHSPCSDAKPQTTKRYFGKLVAIAVLLAVVSLVYRRSRNDNKALPKSYALCSSAGAVIYTVDSENTVTQCLLVHDSRILHAGSLGKYIAEISFLLVHLTLDFPVEVKRMWDANSSTAHDQEFQSTFHAPLEVRYIPDNAIVVPGMSGMWHKMTDIWSGSYPFQTPTDTFSNMEQADYCR